MSKITKKNVVYTSVNNTSHMSFTQGWILYTSGAGAAVYVYESTRWDMREKLMF